jgi:hypothetical protein
MKSNTTAVTLVGAALLSAAAAVAQTPPTPGRAMNGTLIEATVPSTNVPVCRASGLSAIACSIEATAPSTNVPAPVPITYYLPKDYDAKRAQPYPLLIQLHGGGGSNKVAAPTAAETRQRLHGVQVIQGAVRMAGRISDLPTCSGHGGQIALSRIQFGGASWPQRHKPEPH